MVDTTLNPFSGVITSGMKTMFSDAISSLLLNTACTSPCRIIYGGTKYTDCVNCIYDAIGQKSSNRYQNGGPVPFQMGTLCPVCNGLGKIADEPTEENVSLMVIWDYKQWINFNLNTRSPDGLAQTLSTASLTPKLLRADRVVFATDIEGYVRHQFTRDGEAEPCGFGNNDFVSIMWRRIG